MNFPLGVIIIVGVLAAIILGLIASSPDDIIEPRIIPTEENLIACTLQWEPMCGIDGETYGNLCMLDAADVKLDYQGECVVAQPEPSPTISAMPAPPETHTIEIPEGSGVPGCDETNECYIPYSLEIRVGDTIVWDNVDTAVHTVTSGNPSVGDNVDTAVHTVTSGNPSAGVDVDTAVHTVTSGNPSVGIDGLFDSGVLMSGDTFEFTFNDAGTFDYFCIVHHWMTGTIIVNEVEEMIVISESETVEEETMEEEIVMEEAIEKTEAEPEPETSPMTLTVSIPEGVGVPGCETTTECYLPYEVDVAVGTTVTWTNGDTAVHTVTSGNPSSGVDELFDSSIIMSGDTFEFTFNDAGTFDYYCFVHPWMAGIVNVS